MKMKSVLILTVLLSLSASLSFGEDPKPETKVYKKSESHQFTGLKLKGELKKPELSYIYKRKGLRAEKIVNIPQDFNEKIFEAGRQF